MVQHARENANASNDSDVRSLRRNRAVGWEELVRVHVLFASRQLCG